MIECKYLDESDKKLEWKCGYIVEETETGYIIAVGGLVNRNKKDVKEIKEI